MKYETNECVGCPSEIGCVGSSCPNRHTLHYVCDECGDELNPEELCIYEDDSQLCMNCLFNEFPKVG